MECHKYFNLKYGTDTLYTVDEFIDGNCYAKTR